MYLQGMSILKWERGPVAWRCAALSRTAMLCWGMRWCCS